MEDEEGEDLDVQCQGKRRRGEERKWGWRRVEAASMESPQCIRSRRDVDAEVEERARASTTVRFAGTGTY